MSAATGGLRRRHPPRAGRPPHAAVELGAAPVWPASELQRVRTQARELARARTRRHARGVIALAAAAATVAATLGVNVLEAIGAAVLGAVAWWVQQTGGETPVVARWRTWAHGRRVLERELLAARPRVAVLWDRRVYGLPAPAILAVGPSGAWTLWWPEPGIEVHADPHAAATAVSDTAGLPAVAYVLARPSQQLRMFVHDMACAPAVASRDDVSARRSSCTRCCFRSPSGWGCDRPATSGACACAGESIVAGRGSDRRRGRRPDSRADPALHRGLAGSYREAIAARSTRCGRESRRQPTPRSGMRRPRLIEWARFRQRQWESEQQPTPPSAAAHVLVAPSLAELTLASVRDDGMLDLGEMYEAAELASRTHAARFARCFATGGAVRAPSMSSWRLTTAICATRSKGSLSTASCGVWRAMCDGSTPRGRCRRRQEDQMAVGEVRAFYEALGIELPGWARTEAPVRCFADPEAHKREDRDASCSVNLHSGAFNCHGCGARGGAYDAALARGRSPREAIDLMVAVG